MFFSKLARFIAIALFAIGLLTLLFGMLPMVAGTWGPDEIARFGKLGKYLDLGIYSVLVAVALGTLAEVSLSLNKLSAGWLRDG
jgi:hypothetical protein